LEKLTSFESWFNFFAGGLNLQTVVPISQASLPTPPSIASLQHPIPKRLLTGQLIQEIPDRLAHSEDCSQVSSFRRLLTGQLIQEIPHGQLI
jgi:hypothetical protein